MANPGGYHNPHVESADFKNSDEALAYEQGHDADLPINGTPISKEIAVDEEKADTLQTDTPAEHDPNDVWWDGDDDPQNPQNWSSRKKWSNVAILSYVTLIT
jgi:hypothetical protein